LCHGKLATHLTRFWQYQNETQGEKNARSYRADAYRTLKGYAIRSTIVANKSTVSLDDILSALQTIVVSQNDITSRLAALENGATVKTAPIASQPTADAPQTAQRAARRQNAAQKNTAPKAPAGTLTGTVVRIARGGYGLLLNVNGAEMWANAPAKGKNNKKLPALFKDMTPGQSVTLTLDEFARVMPESVTASTTPAVKTPEPAVKTPTPAVKTPEPVSRTCKNVCPFCAGGHPGNYSVKEVTRRCLMTQFERETGLDADDNERAFVDWKETAPRQVFAKNATGSRFVGGPIGTTAPAVKTTPPISKVELAHRAQIAASATAHTDEPVAPAVAPSPVQTRNVSKLADGTFEVLLRQFPRKQTGMMMIWSADTFNGTGKNEGKGVWLTNIDETLYAKLVKFAPNDKLSITIKDGALAKAKRLDSIEKVSGVVPGVATSGRNDAPMQVTGTRQDDTKREAKAAARRSGARQTKATAGKPVYKCSGTAQHRTTCFGRCVNAA
jgi:hypothetical protein